MRHHVTPLLGLLLPLAAAASPSGPVELPLGNGAPAWLDFYGDNIFRIFHDPAGGPLRSPESTPPAEILVKNPRKAVGRVTTRQEGDLFLVETPAVSLAFNPATRTLDVTDLRTGRKVIEGASMGSDSQGKTTVTLGAQPDEWFFGGGVQNGRFSHRGQQIEIVNTNSWTDGGVASPTPFYWSTGGYGVMWHTFAPGLYDFTQAPEGKVTLTHDTPVADIFVMVDDTPEELLGDFYQLTGRPVLLPKFGFYEGHLNAYNRDYWKETEEGGVLFEDGRRWKESQRDNGGVRESLNGENGNYQFSARAVIDRYNAADMPLGWVLPNDGYGAGYGRAETLDGNVANLKSFGDYAREKGVEIGLWTQSDLHPVDSLEALLQRDIVKEVRDAGVRVLKTDVAWVGDGYSFGLNGVADVAEIMPREGGGARPFIISLDGWAGTQRHAGVWSGDQTGGEWEYIRFHIPTYIGSGLSGQPNITSDMDGIFGGGNTAVNVRDFEWKTFTPMQLNMDGWGRNPKYPQAVGQFKDARDAVGINRAYLKLKSQLLPYAYTAAREATEGKPMVRAMMLERPSDFTLGTATRYQFMYGPSLLVAPVYKATHSDSLGNDVRNGIYLPEGTWFDYFTSRPYEGGKVWNMVEAPLWKLPVFVKADAIIPMANPNNNPSQIDRGLRIYEFWPQREGRFTEYDDDGTTQSYLSGEFTTTKVTSDVNGGVLTIAIAPTEGGFTGFQPVKRTELGINASAEPRQVTARVGGKKVKLRKTVSVEEFEKASNAWGWVTDANRLKHWGASEAENLGPQIWVKLAAADTRRDGVEVEVKGFRLDAVPDTGLPAGVPPVPEVVASAENDVTPYSVTLRWDPQEGADCVEIEHDGMLYTNLDATGRWPEFTFEDLRPETCYNFKLRSRNGAGVSEWTEVAFTTKDNPLEYALRGLSALSTLEEQPGFELARLFDFKESGDQWHTAYGKRNATPFDVVVDLGTFSTLDRLDYLPRLDGGNGTLLEGTVEVSENGKDWTDPEPFVWTRSGETKSHVFGGRPQARFIRLHVEKSVGGFGSGREIYVFKAPGTPSYIPGDINNDGKVDENDLTSYANYTGLRRGDADYDYVSVGDVNRNGLIDAYDISYVARALSGADGADAQPGSGTVEVRADRNTAAKGETVTLTVTGKDLRNLNAVSLAIPYDGAVWEVLGVENLAVKEMHDMTYDRVHTSGTRELMPTFVGLGSAALSGEEVPLMKVMFRAKRGGKVTLRATDTVLADGRPVGF